MSAPVVQDVEVVAKAKRRHFSAKEKLRVLELADAATVKRALEVAHGVAPGDHVHAHRRPLAEKFRELLIGACGGLAIPAEGGEIILVAAEGPMAVQAMHDEETGGCVGTFATRRRRTAAWGVSPRASPDGRAGPDDGCRRRPPRASA